MIAHCPISRLTGPGLDRTWPAARGGGGGEGEGEGFEGRFGEALNVVRALLLNNAGRGVESAARQR